MPLTKTTTWLEATPQIDLGHPKLRITAQKLTQSRQSMAARAVAVHEFVRRMPFQASAGYKDLRASTVLRRAAGDCHTKGLLFTALCRAAGLPARLLVVRVRSDFLRGVLDSLPDEIDHVVGQVHIDGDWVSTDGYVVDPVLFARARYALRSHSLDSGWGIVIGARGRWDGLANCLQQFRQEDVVATVGVFGDLDEYLATVADARARWIDSLKYAIGVYLLNRRVSRVRTERLTPPVGLS